MSDAEDLISVYQAANVTEAYFVKNLLIDADIEATVSEENEPLAGLPIAAPDVLVRKLDEAHAREVVATYEAEQIRRAERPDWTCPKCKATVVGAFDRCDVCGTDRPGDEDEDEDEE